MELPGRPHVLVLPVPAQGHIAPMLAFSYLLAARGVVVTFINTEKAHARILLSSGEDKEGAEGELQTRKKKSSGVRFETMPDGSQEPLPGFQPSFNISNVMNILKGMESRQGVLEEIVVRSRATAHPITCIISDSLFPWTSPLATKLGIQRVVFWTSNGASLATAVELKSGKLKLAGDGELTAGLPIAASEFRSKLLPQEPERLKFFMDKINGLEDTTCVVVNTFEELEGSSLDACASCGTKVHHIGPLVPPGDHEGDWSVSFYKEESSCIEWLDKQVAGSVLYVSFGSMASLAPQELALGIEESKQAFLWVFREYSDQSLLAEFIDRTCDRGLVVKWAPQAKVLDHPAVGAFLTHCGWNSVLESINSGVPMLCYPMMMHDQHLNAMIITRIWKLGIALLKDGQKGVITREEIRSGVLNVLSSKELHVNLSAWKVRAHSSLQEGGCSYNALEQFVDSLRRVS